ncbi:MAG: SIS domain-containing protein [Sphaerochaeta sp.]|nr:SIS domain-containing protein [Sphaerochaeta sp.]
MKSSTEMIVDDLVKRYPILGHLRKEIVGAYVLMLRCYNYGGKILVCGNGGSDSDSAHIVGELMKGFIKKRPLLQSEQLYSSYPEIAEKLQYGIPAISLGAHTALASAFSNDVSPDLVYAQQVFSYYRESDVLLCLSTSGNSTNVVSAAKTMRSLGGDVISCTGRHGGLLQGLSHITIQVPESETYKVQELHLPIYHCICAMLEEELFD